MKFHPDIPHGYLMINLKRKKEKNQKEVTQKLRNWDQRFETQKLRKGEQSMFYPIRQSWSHTHRYNVSSNYYVRLPSYGAQKKKKKKKKKKVIINTPAERTDSRTTHSRSLIRIFTGRILDSQGCKFLHTDNEDSDQANAQFDLSSLDAHVKRCIFSRCG